MTPRCAFVGQPETNGVIERFFRTLKAQVLHGCVFETIEDVRDAMRAVIARTNAAWLVENTGDLSPHGQRRNHDLAVQPVAAYPDRCSKEPGPVHDLLQRAESGSSSAGTKSQTASSTATTP
jgi:transposase InsO family protein